MKTVLTSLAAAALLSGALATSAFAAERSQYAASYQDRGYAATSCSSDQTPGDPIYFKLADGRCANDGNGNGGVR
ncbi:MAG: hypothetical protein KGI57_05500 [Hyphomicrobiales bacterium]|nr:hypothetical protein [Hyphomicrobiales bacterium]MDE2017143.1 hypothetical protein [Hyphomicrobiales bacterium]